MRQARQRKSQGIAPLAGKISRGKLVVSRAFKRAFFVLFTLKSLQRQAFRRIAGVCHGSGGSGCIRIISRKIRGSVQQRIARARAVNRNLRPASRGAENVSCLRRYALGFLARHRPTHQSHLVRKALRFAWRFIASRRACQGIRLKRAISFPFKGLRLKNLWRCKPSVARKTLGVEREARREVY